MTGKPKPPMLFVERRARRYAEHQARQKMTVKVIEPPVEEGKPSGRTRASSAKKKTR
jgi:hypothetical protein